MSHTETTARLRRIAGAATLVMALFIISRLLGLLREIVIARQFGTSAEMDAYLAAFRLPDLLFYVVAGGALGSAFIPTFAGFLARKDYAGGWQLASAVINWVILILSLLGAIAAIFAPWLVRTLYSAFPPTQQALTVAHHRQMTDMNIVHIVLGIHNG